MVLGGFDKSIPVCQNRLLREMMSNFESLPSLRIEPEHRGAIHWAIGIVRFMVYVVSDGRGSPFWFYTMDPAATNESMVLSCPSDDTGIILSAARDITRTYRCPNG